MSGQQSIFKVSISYSKVQNTDAVQDWATQISNSLPDFAISNVTANAADLSFDLATKDKNPIAAKDVGLKIKKITDLNNPPFKILRGNVVDKVVGDDMWSWD
jgi:hypothetical protein